MSGNSQERRSSKVAIPTRQGSFNAEPYSHRTYLNSPNQNDYLSGRRGSVESIADAIHAMATGREKVLSSSPKTFDAEFLSGKGNEASRNGKSAVAPIDQSTSDQPATDEIEFPLPNVEKFVFISPNFPPVVAEYARALRQRGITVLGIGDAAYDSLSWELRQNLTEYYKILSPGGLHDYEECLKACGFFTWKYGRLHRIESFNETWLPLESRLRQDLNVPGLLPTDLIMMRTKSGMRDLFTSHEVPNPGGMMAESLEALLEYIDGPNGVGWPGTSIH